MPTGEETARAASLLTRHLAIGKRIFDPATTSAGKELILKVWELVLVPGSIPPVRSVISSEIDNQFSIGEFDGVRSFVRQ